MRSHNICFCWEIRKIIFKLSIITPPPHPPLFWMTDSYLIWQACSSADLPYPNNPNHSKRRIIHRLQFHSILGAITLYIMNSELPPPYQNVLCTKYYLHTKTQFPRWSKCMSTSPCFLSFSKRDLFSGWWSPPYWGQLLTLLHSEWPELCT